MLMSPLPLFIGQRECNGIYPWKLTSCLAASVSQLSEKHKRSNLTWRTLSNAGNLSWWAFRDIIYSNIECYYLQHWGGIITIFIIIIINIIILNMLIVHGWKRVIDSLSVRWHQPHIKKWKTNKYKKREWEQVITNMNINKYYFFCDKNIV